MTYNMNDIYVYVISSYEFEVVFNTYLDLTNIKITENKINKPFSYVRKNNDYSVVYKLKEKFILDKVYVLNVDNKSVIFSFEKFYKTQEFYDQYYYDESDLGVTIRNELIEIKVWSPTAEAIDLVLIDRNDHIKINKEMTRSKKGTWIITIDKKYKQWLYKFKVYRNKLCYEVIDPYARAVTANGQEGVIVDLSCTKYVQKHITNPILRNEAIIYETHVRDFTIDEDSGVKLKGKYLGFIEEQCFNSYNHKTCLPYVRDLGFTHIELLPLHDYEGVDELNPEHSYNWGYNPANFFVPEGSFSLNPSNPISRVVELKTLIEGIHKHGIRVILDFVFNHVYDINTSPLEKLVPGYYFRRDELGNLTNGSGCGNDFASENKMARKFILDCVRFWIEEYNIDGIRLDLMGNLDIDTVKGIAEVCFSLKPDFILIGEGWNLNTNLPVTKRAVLENASTLSNIGFFNDQYRDGLKGSSFNLSHKGLGLGGEVTLETFEKILLGRLHINNKNVFTKPSQSVNYIECHDNHTIWDKMVVSNYFEDEKCRASRQLLLNSILLISHGIVFFHSGQEFCRTKFHDGNSYKSGDDINKIRWKSINKHLSSINKIKELIAFRKRAGIYKIDDYLEINKHMDISFCDTNLIKIVYENVLKFGEYEEIIIHINFDTKNKEIEHHKNYYEIVNSSTTCNENQLIISPLSLKILTKNKYSP